MQVEIFLYPKKFFFQDFMFEISSLSLIFSNESGLWEHQSIRIHSVKSFVHRVMDNTCGVKAVSFM